MSNITLVVLYCIVAIVLFIVFGTALWTWVFKHTK